MGQPSRALEIWLPPVADWAGLAAGPARWLARGERLADGPADPIQALQEGIWAEPGAALPVAALLRQQWAGDAGRGEWLAADPAWIQPDMNGARLLACQRMQLAPAEAETLAGALAPLFAEHGIQLLATTPEHWQLRLPPGLLAPVLAAPSAAMGADVLAFLPTGAAARRWRQLWNEAQTVLHAHPLNAQRLARGLPPVNSLWFWGGGALPDTLHSRWQGLLSHDPVLQAAAQGAGLQRPALAAASLAAVEGNWLLDLQSCAGLDWSAWLPALARCGRQMPLIWRLPDGRRWQHQRWHRWRYWRHTWTA